MPWNAMSVMDQKVRFIADRLANRAPMAVLCDRYGISRQTGYEWCRRYEAEGAAGLEERSRAPLSHGRAMRADLAVRLIEARKQRPFWGPKKLLAILKEASPGEPWPSSSAVSDLLRREGLSEPRRRQRRSLSVEQPFDQAKAPNDVWCIDFKGWFRTGDGERCDPLTTSDAATRFLLVTQGLQPTGREVQACMDEAFQEYGVPLAMRSDNGPPFAATGAGGLTQLSVHWAKIGIRLERIELGKPQQNGRHERMHGTLKAEVCDPPKASLREQQAAFDTFRQDYNHVRPHEALGQKPPARLYERSSRPFPKTIPEPTYGEDDVVRRVRSSGEIKWNGSFLYVSEVLAGEPIALKRQDDGHWVARFIDIPLLRIDRAGRVSRYGPGRPARTIAP